MENGVRVSEEVSDKAAEIKKRIWNDGQNLHGGEARTQGGGRGFRWWLVVGLTQLHGDTSFSWTTRTGEEEQQAKAAGERVVTASCRSRVKVSWAPRRERMG